MEDLPAKSELADNTLLSEIEPIEQGGLSVESRDELKHLVEAPLLEACQQFFDKGIRTVFSSANKKYVGTNAHIALDFESLSPANKAIALSVGKEGIIHGSIQRKCIYIEIPVAASATLGEIKQKALTMVDKFENQKKGV